MKTELKIFFSVFLLFFCSIFLTIFELIPLYYGHPLRNPLEFFENPTGRWEGGTPSSYVSILFTVILFWLSLAAAGISVVAYRSYKHLIRSRKA